MTTPATPDPTPETTPPETALTVSVLLAHPNDKARKIVTAIHDVAPNQTDDVVSFFAGIGNDKGFDLTAYATLANGNDDAHVHAKPHVHESDIAELIAALLLSVPNALGPTR